MLLTINHIEVALWQSQGLSHLHFFACMYVHVCICVYTHIRHTSACLWLLITLRSLSGNPKASPTICAIAALKTACPKTKTGPTGWLHTRICQYDTCTENGVPENENRAHGLAAYTPFFNILYVCMYEKYLFLCVSCAFVCYGDTGSWMFENGHHISGF